MSAYAILLEDRTIQLKKACCNSGLALIQFTWIWVSSTFSPGWELICELILWCGVRLPCMRVCLQASIEPQMATRPTSSMCLSYKHALSSKRMMLRTWTCRSLLYNLSLQLNSQYLEPYDTIYLHLKNLDKSHKWKMSLWQCSRCVHTQPLFQWLVVVICFLWFYFWGIVRNKVHNDNHNHNYWILTNYFTTCSWK